MSGVAWKGLRSTRLSRLVFYVLQYFKAQRLKNAFALCIPFSGERHNNCNGAGDWPKRRITHKKDGSFECPEQIQRTEIEGLWASKPKAEVRRSTGPKCLSVGFARDSPK